MRFRLVPKSTTLDDLERPVRTLFQNTWVFGTTSFWQCNVYANIPGDSSKRGRQATVGLSTTIFHVFAGYIFGNFRGKDSIFTQRYGVPHRLSTDPKIRDLE